MTCQWCRGDSPHTIQDCPDFPRGQMQASSSPAKATGEPYAPTDAKDVISALSGQRRALTDLIMRYAQHDTDCPKFVLHSHWDFYKNKPCDCGLTQALVDARLPAFVLEVADHPTEEVEDDL
jgi:hypothetical protein